MLGPDQPVILQMLDIPPAAETLDGVKMELVDAAFPLPKENNITCLTRLDHNRALGQVSERLLVQVSDVKNVIIWGNHSSTQYPDVKHATMRTQVGGKLVRELVANDAWQAKWREFSTTVHKEGLPSLRQGNYPVHCHLLVLPVITFVIGSLEVGTPEGTWVSMGVYSDGLYNVLIPVTGKDGKWAIVHGKYSMRSFGQHIWSNLGIGSSGYQ